MPILNWLTRDEDVRAAARVPYRLLEKMPELSAGEPGADNILMQGNNLEALKALLPFYAGRVKCIYIDPPFNTGQAYEDYDDNIEHSIWLGMMYARLELLREFLSEAGTIAIHLDDEELAYCIGILDEIFGRNNRINLVTFRQGAAVGHKAINPWAGNRYKLHCHLRSKQGEGLEAKPGIYQADQRPQVRQFYREFRGRTSKLEIGAAFGGLRALFRFDAPGTQEELGGGTTRLHWTALSLKMRNGWLGRHRLHTMASAKQPGS